jgi:hypothetical protein
MPLRSALAGQFGMVAETTYNTLVTVSRFLEINEESLDIDIGKIYSTGIRAGNRVTRSDRVKTYTKGAAGTLSFDLMNKGFGLLHEMAFGSNTVTTVSGTARKHTIVMDANGAYGKSATMQLGRPGTGGAVHPFTLGGCKVTKFGLSLELEKAAVIEVGVDAASVVTATALASASYPTAQEMFIFAEGDVKIAGSTVFAPSFKFDYDPKYMTDRRSIGNTKKEPLVEDYADIGGSVGLEFEDLTHYAREVAGTQTALLLTMTLASEANTGVPFSYTLTLPCVEWLPASRNIKGPDRITIDAPFKVLNNGTDEPVKVEYVTTDTAS